MDFADNNLNFLSLRNMDPAFIRSFREHFAYVNPWNRYWQTVPNGTVALSEDVSPARRFATTEFYNDWLLPQRDVEAGVGLKLYGEGSEQVTAIMHFSLSLSDRYGKAAVEILNRIRGNIERSISLARLLRRGTEAGTASTALVERSRCAAFVVDEGRRLHDANEMALALFSAGSVATARNDRCHLADRDADARFGAVLKQLAKNIPVEGPIVLRTATGAWQVVTAALPTPSWSPPMLAILPPRRLMLVLINDLTRSRLSPDLSGLTAAFGLTPAEIGFCRRLLEGDSITDAADHTGVAVETARTRLKSIFHKTGTSRQAQLMLLLANLL